MMWDPKSDKVKAYADVRHWDETFTTPVHPEISIVPLPLAAVRKTSSVFPRIYLEEKMTDKGKHVSQSDHAPHKAKANKKKKAYLDRSELNKNQVLLHQMNNPDDPMEDDQNMLSVEEVFNPLPLSTELVMEPPSIKLK